MKMSPFCYDYVKQLLGQAVQHNMTRHMRTHTHARVCVCVCVTPNH